MTDLLYSDVDPFILANRFLVNMVSGDEVFYQGKVVFKCLNKSKKTFRWKLQYRDNKPFIAQIVENVTDNCIEFLPSFNRKKNPLGIFLREVESFILLELLNKGNFLHEPNVKFLEILNRECVWKII